MQTDKLIDEVPVQYMARFIRWLHFDAGGPDEIEVQRAAVVLAARLHGRLEKRGIHIPHPGSSLLSSFIQDYR